MKLPVEFQPWPKIPRYSAFNIRVTEKIDGTNGCIIIGEDGSFGVQSRSRLITPEDDNFGFAKWAYENQEELMTLGHGRHFGEWYGKGIQRGYNKEEKRFALFNTFRPSEGLPTGVELVPLLYDGQFDLEVLRNLEQDLKQNGSNVTPGYMNPEGMVIYFYTSKERVKWIINK